MPEPGSTPAPGTGLPPRQRHRRARRAAMAMGLAAVFITSAMVGAAVSPVDLRALTDLVAGGPTPATAPAASAAAPASPTGASPAPTASPSPTPTASPSPTPIVAASVSKRLQRTLEAARKRYGLPGVSATIILPNGATWSGVAGYADSVKRRKVAVDTPFAVASVTKTFTAALILRLADQGKLSIDDHLSKWLPSYPNARRITLRMLLQHTSGLPDFFASGALETAMLKNRRRVFTPAEVLTFARGLRFTPGTGYYYSNTNFVLLGLVAEKAGGKPWATQVHTELLDPLGLTGTYIQASEKPPGRAAAHGYRYFSGAVVGRGRDQGDRTGVVPFTSVVTAAWSAGAIAATTPDLARWARALYTGRVLSPASTRAMMDVGRTTKLGASRHYGLGMSRLLIGGRFIGYGHSGSIGGFRSAIRYFPKEHTAVAVLFNRDFYKADQVVGLLMKALYPKP
jgi:D-alanyl-D-alanine carboxypeptidase